MSLLFSDGFDVYGASGVKNNNQPVDHWTSASINAQGGLFVQPGRYTGSSSMLVLGADKNYTTLSKEISSMLSTGGKLIIGFNCKVNTNTSSISYFYLSPIYSTNSQYNVLEFRSGNIYVANGDTTYNVTFGQWHHIEMEFDRTANTYTLYLDGNSINSRSWSYDASFFTIRHLYDDTGSAPSTAYHFIDDFYILDGNGTSANDRIGSTARIDTLLPSGATSSADWSGTNASISGIAPNDNTTITAAASGDISVFTFTDAQSQNFADANAISIRVRAADTDSAGATIQPVVNGTSPVNAGSAFDPGTSFDEFQLYIDTNPETSSKFTAAEINALELGVKSN